MLERYVIERKKHEAPAGVGDAGPLIDRYIAEKGPELKSEKSWARIGRYARNALRDADVAKIEPGDIADVLAFWDGKATMQHHVRSFLSGFFYWCVKKRLALMNPVRDIKIKAPKRRKVYIPDGHFLAIRAALATFSYERADGKTIIGRNSAGAMMQCFVDLCYLTAQRSTEIRTLKWSQIDRNAGVIHFLPSKTEDSSGAAVDFAITPEIDAVLNRIREIDGRPRIGDANVIHNRKGEPYASTAFLAAWDRAMKRIGLGDQPYTIKDIRAKALTDAKRAGYDIKELMVAAAHTREQTTHIYVKQRDIPVSHVHLQMPKSA
ncbi:tyrosine-type recombinase/integrase [Caballeronia grimmiae]|uniref:tyrosine-type recombinase/integrase n=1 Tax=Caballeronia grimmiae TaxID=1071679 RepID=UPI0038B8B325